MARLRFILILGLVAFIACISVCEFQHSAHAVISQNVISHLATRHQKLTFLLENSHCFILSLVHMIMTVHIVSVSMHISTVDLIQDRWDAFWSTF